MDIHVVRCDPQKAEETGACEESSCGQTEAFRYETIMKSF